MDPTTLTTGIVVSAATAAPTLFDRGRTGLDPALRKVSTTKGAVRTARVRAEVPADAMLGSHQPSAGDGLTKADFLGDGRRPHIGFTGLRNTASGTSSGG